MNSSRILSRFFKQTWRGYSAGKGMYQPAGRPQSATARYFEYLQSPAGKKALMIGSMVFSIGVFGTKLLPSTPQAQKYIQSFYQSYYSPNKVTPVTRRFGEDIVNKVVLDMDLKESQAGSLIVFAGNLEEPSIFGAFESGSVLLGYPPFFNVFQEDELPDMLKAKFGMKVGDDIPEISNIRSREGKSFRQSLYLSDDAKKFALARELNMALHSSIIFPPGLSALAVHLVYFTCRGVNHLLPFLSRSFAQRWGIYFAVSFFVYVLHRKGQDFYHNNRICQADKMAAGLGPKYKEGGIEYYEKLLQRNVALRTLIPHKRGARLYNMKGNPTSALFGSKLTISQRLRLIVES